LNKSEARLWTKDFIIAWIICFLVSFTFMILMTNIAVYAAETFNASQSKAGLVSGIFIIGALCARFWTGKYINLVGRRRLLGGSLALFFLAAIAYFQANSLNLLLLTRFIHGCAYGISSTTLATVAMNIIPRPRLGEGTSYYSMSAALASATGPFVGVLLTQQLGFTVVFMVCVLFSTASLAVFLGLRVVEAEEEQGNENRVLARDRSFKAIFRDFFEVHALPIAIVIAVIGFAYSGIFSLLTSYAKEIALTDAASVFFLISAVCILTSRPFTGRLFDRKGANMVVYPAFVSFALGLTLIGLAQSGLTLLCAAAAVGLGYGTLISCGQAIAVKESPKENIGLAVSTFFVCLDSGVGIGPFVLGYIIPYSGFRGMYLALAVLVLCSIFLYHFLYGGRESMASG